MTTIFRVCLCLTLLIATSMNANAGFLGFGGTSWKEEVLLHDGSKIIVNRHGVAKEIWVAARAGGFHFRWDGAVWRDTRDGTELMEKLSALTSQQAGESIRFN